VVSGTVAVVVVTVAVVTVVMDTKILAPTS
jgi:hypothetical protein